MEEIIVMALLLGFFGCFFLYSVGKSIGKFLWHATEPQNIQEYERVAGGYPAKWDTVNCTIISNRLRDTVKLVTIEEDYFNKMVLDEYWLFSRKMMKVLYHGHITCGFDMTKVRVENTADGLFNIIIPRPEILSNEILERDVLFIKNGWWNIVTDKDRDKLETRGKQEFAQGKYQEFYNDSLRHITSFINRIMDSMPNRISYTLRVEGIPVNLRTGEQCSNSNILKRISWCTDNNERGLVRRNNR